MPGSLTTPSRPDARAVAHGYVAFHHLHGVGTQNGKLSRLNGWPMRSPVNASPEPSRATSHDSGPMWIATPSSQGTCTLYSLPVSRRFANVVRFSPQSGHRELASVCPFSAKSCREQMQQINACAYSITSSARPSNVMGKVRPSPLAVLRLMTNSTLTNC
jgi:hypothetical protein